MSRSRMDRPTGPAVPTGDDHRVSARNDARRRGGVMSMRVRALSLVAAVTAALAAAMALAGSASAILTRHTEPFSPLTGSGSGITLEKNKAAVVAVDEATGNVFVTNNVRGTNGGIVILGGEGGAPAGLVSPFLIPGLQLTNLFGAFLAYDSSASSPSQGTLYAYDRSAEVIRRYVRNASTEQYEEVAGKEITVTGCARYENLGGGGVNDQGDLFVPCDAREQIYEFDPSGALIHEYSLAGTPLVEHGEGYANGIAVGTAGDLFVSKSAGGVYKLPVNLAGEVEPQRYGEVAPEGAGVAYEPAANEVIVTQYNHGGAEEYNASTLAKVGAFGGEVLRGPLGVAVNVSTHRVYVADIVKGNIAVFGPDVIVPTTDVTAASNITGTKATLNGTVNPENIAVEECFFEYGETTSYGHTAPCESLPPTDGETHPVSANVTGLKSNGATYHVRLVTANENGTEHSGDKTFVTAGTVVTQAASGVSSEAATLNGYVRPEGDQYSECVFEYKVSTESSYHEAACTPAAAEIEPDFAAHTVSAQLEELQPNAKYVFRLKATNSSATHYGEVLSFTTTGPPQIGEVRASDATEGSATLEASIDPSGYDTYYRFEWGATESYGHVIPADFEPYIGSGSAPIRVKATLSGLSAGTVYHYRVVAENTLNGRSTTESGDQTLETLDSCGLPDGRCFELVSPRNLGLASLPTDFQASIQLHYQAGEGPGSLAYVINGGLANATRGTEDVYRSTRSEAGWEASQISPSITARNEVPGQRADPDAIYALSPDLKCGFLGSSQPLTNAPEANLILEAGGANLYRLNPDGSYTLLTTRPPERLEAASHTLDGEFQPIGLSSDCSRFVFSTTYAYPGVAGSTGRERLYEWSEAGGLKNVGWVPNGSGGESGVEAVGGSGNGEYADLYHAVSEDGSRIFFTAKRIVAGNPGDPGEAGKEGVFVREDGTATRDVSASETSTPDTGATFAGATPDGSRVYFLANAGLTAQSSAEGTDLYEYDLETEQLTDLSVGHQAGGAEATGLMGVANDGSYVYFVARGQLTPEQGATLAQNEAENTFSVYEESEGKVHFVGALSGREYQASRHATVAFESTARVSPEGRYLLFESSVNVTGYDSGGAPEAYLYDASTGKTVCLSCRQDGRPSVNINPGEGYFIVLADGHLQSQRLDAPQSLVTRDGAPLVFFRTKDALAAGAVEGRQNLYEWAHGQVFLIASGSQYSSVTLYGASEEGTDVYFNDKAALTWENPQSRPAAWDARVGGGFAEPPPSPAACDPLTEGSCQGPESQPPSLALPPTSVTFSGPGNAAPAPPKTSKTSQTGKHHKHRRKHREHRGKHRKHRGRRARRSRHHGGRHHGHHARRARRHRRRHGHAARHANGKGRAGK